MCQPLDSVLARIFCDGGEGGANPNVSAGCLGFPPFPICARSPQVPLTPLDRAYTYCTLLTKKPTPAESFFLQPIHIADHNVEI